MLPDVQKGASSEVGCGLAEEVVRTFGEVRLRVVGTSMVPSILPGDLLSIRKASARDMSFGDVVVFQQCERLLVHRVVGRKVATTPSGTAGEPFLITRGDRLRQDDPPVASSDLLGRVVSLERNNRKIDLPLPESHGPLARLFRASDRATYLYLRLVDCWRTLFLRRAKCQV